MGYPGITTQGIKVIGDDGALAAMTAEVSEWCKEKGWDGERSFGDCMALLHSEVSEALEAFRKWGTKDGTGKEGKLAHTDDGTVEKPEGVGSEFADVLIRLLDDCGRYGINLFAEYRRKMDYNYTRSFRHGGKAL